MATFQGVVGYFLGISWPIGAVQAYNLLFFPILSIPNNRIFGFLLQYFFSGAIIIVVVLLPCYGVWMEPTSSDTLLHIDDLSWQYPQAAQHLFENFRFDLKQGEFRVLMGASGTGKTTLVKLLIGELSVPHKTIFYREEDIAHFSPLDRENYRKKIGVVFQDYKLFDKLTVQENVAYPLNLFGLGETIIEYKVHTILKTLGLFDNRETPVQLLSAGEKQKVCLARALVHDPEFIIADEPTGNLDWEHTQQVADLLIQANQQGNTVFLITHDIHLVHYLKEKHAIKLDILR